MAAGFTLLEALVVLDCTDDIDAWARRRAQAGGATVAPVACGIEPTGQVPAWLAHRAVSSPLAAVRSLHPHQVKLVKACQRGSLPPATAGPM